MKEIKLEAFSHRDIYAAIAMMSLFFDAGNDSIKTAIKLLKKETRRPPVKPTPQKKQVSQIFPKCKDCGADCDVLPVNASRGTHLENSNIRSVVFCRRCLSEQFSEKYTHEIIEELNGNFRQDKNIQE